MSITTEQGILFALIVAIFGFLLWGRYRYDLVAFAALVIACLLGVVPVDQAFSGFGHPAVVIIALVLIVSRGLYRSGAIEMLAGTVIDASRSLQAHVGIMAGIAAALSGIMNNVAALALLMPLDVQAAQKAKRSPALTLMPLSFASILGGMVTLIGTPPNIVVATFRGNALGEPYSMFDFAPVGIVVATAGVLFVTLVGWRLIPAERTRTSSSEELEDLKGYIAELRVPESADIMGEKVRDLDDMAEDNEVQIVGLSRRKKRLPGAARREIIQKSDRIIVEGGPDAIEKFAGAAGLKYTDTDKPTKATSGTTRMMEVAVPEGSRIAGNSARDIGLMRNKSVMLLGISRHGKRIRERLRQATVRSGDLLLLLGPEDRLPEVVDWLGCLPLAER